MGRSERLEIIAQIEHQRNSTVLAYVTGDRENINTRVAPDVVRVFYRHLDTLGAAERLDLFLYTRGGDVLTPWRLVNLFREYTGYFSVLVPFRAYSAGTLICLGANEILMGKLGELGPIDPSVANAFNPQDPNNPSARIPVSVEDVSSYMSLAREASKPDGLIELTQVFGYLSEKVHPLALGNVHRNYSLIRSLARKLLLLHLAEKDEKLIKDIIDNLTEKLYAHNHMISRWEAANEINLAVVKPTDEMERMMWQLYVEYEEDLELLLPFNPTAILGQAQQVEFEISGGVIESRARRDDFIFSGMVTRPEMSDGAPGGGANVNMEFQGWRQTQ